MAGERPEPIILDHDALEALQPLVQPHVEAIKAMIDRERLLEFQIKREDDWQKFQAQLAADDKKWKETQEGAAEVRHNEQMKTIKGVHKHEMWVMGLAVTGALLVITVFGAAVQAGWFPKWFGVG